MTWVKLHEALQLIAVRRHKGCPGRKWGASVMQDGVTGAVLMSNYVEIAPKPR
jgi:hypothetical protein